MKGRPMLNKVFLEIGNVDARRGADVLLEILLSEGCVIFARKLVEQLYVSSFPKKHQEGLW
jgi:hypothetical protein